MEDSAHAAENDLVVEQASFARRVEQILLGDLSSHPAAFPAAEEHDELFYTRECARANGQVPCTILALDHCIPRGCPPLLCHCPRS